MFGRPLDNLDDSFERPTLNIKEGLFSKGMINDYSDRHHPFEGCFNFRDIGGYPAAGGRSVRWGQLVAVALLSFARRLPDIAPEQLFDGIGHCDCFFDEVEVTFEGVTSRNL